MNRLFTTLTFCCIVTLTSWAINIDRLSDGLVVSAAGTKVRLKVVSEQIIRVSATPDATFPKDASLVVVPVAGNTPFKVTTIANSAVLTTARIKAVVDGTTGAVTFF